MTAERKLALEWQVLRGQEAQAILDQYRGSEEPTRVVHHLEKGITDCRMHGMPGDWPEGHLWSEHWDEVTCKTCLSRRILVQREQPKPEIGGHP